MDEAQARIWLLPRRVLRARAGIARRRSVMPPRRGTDQSPRTPRETAHVHLHGIELVKHDSRMLIVLAYLSHPAKVLKKLSATAW